MTFNQPRVKQHLNSYVVVKTHNGELHYWNRVSRTWLRESRVHGPSVNNPKASYFRTLEAAEKELAKVTG